MKEGYIADTSGVPSEEELKAINRLSRRNLSSDEVFVFSVILCDNEIDRDFERFSVEALDKMAQLYVGKTGIFDHSMKGRDQVARIFHCEVERPAGQTTRCGEAYVRLKARAYMPKTEKNRDMILEIDAGIKKEVSVGCSVDRVLCSVCGTNVKTDRCEHKKGRIYHRAEGDRLCHHILDHPADAYEWSFVAVPAQPKAGVVKAFSGLEKGGIGMEPEAIVKSLRMGQETTLSEKEAGQLADVIEHLQKQAAAGEQYRKTAVEETVRLGILAQPTVDAALLCKMLNGLNDQELCKMKQAFQKQVDALLPPRSQFEETKSTVQSDSGCHDFMI